MNLIISVIIGLIASVWAGHSLIKVINEERTSADGGWFMYWLFVAAYSFSLVIKYSNI